MKRLSLIPFSLLIILFSINVFAQDRLIGARFPAISPDGSTIAFSYVGDIWTVSANGGKAAKLTNNVAYEREPVWSPDGRWIAFTSNRYGNNDVFLIPAGGGDPVQLTYHTGSDIASDFTPDSRYVVFRSSRTSSAGIYKISVNGGNAVPLLDTYWSYPYYAKVHPDNSGIIFALGSENGYWWRDGYRGANSSKIWTKEFDGPAKEIVNDLSNSFWPSYSSDGEMIYFVSDRNNGTKNIWSANADGSNQRTVTRFNENDVTWMSVSDNSTFAVYERNFGIGITDLSSGRSRDIRIDLPIETRTNSSFFVNNENVSDFAVSPDGKKIAAVVRGEIFVMSEEGGYARNVTNTPWREGYLTWDKESRNIIYVSDVGADREIYKVSALGDSEPVKLTDSDTDKLDPRVSPDGEWISYYSGSRQLRMMKPDGSEDQLLVEGYFQWRGAGEAACSPDSKYLAYVSEESDGDIFAVNIETKEIIKLTNTAYDESTPVWSADGKTIYFESNRYGHSFPEFTGKWDIYKLDLVPEKSEFDEDEFEALFEEKKEKEDEEKKEDKKEDELKVEINLENVDRQTSMITNTLGNDGSIVISPKDKETMYFVSNIDGSRHFWKISLEDDNNRYEPFMPAVRSPYNIQFDKKNNKIYYTSRGRIGRINLNSRKSENVSFTTKIEVDKTADYEQMLGEVYNILQHYFYDDRHHNINWKRTYESYLPVLKQVREDNDFYDYANMMIGHLNSSHTGIRAPRSGIRTELPSAHIGAIFNFTGRNIKVDRILKDSPLYNHRDKVRTGDELIEIDGEAVNSSGNIWQKLNGKSGKRLKLTFRSASSGETEEIALKPVSSYGDNRLQLEEWIKSRKDKVKEATNDEIAYLYMRAMGRGDLRRFLLELERDAVPRKGLILDLRWNNGGNVHDRVLDALTRPVYAKWTVRGMAETNQSTYGFADKPVVLIINERTLSDGEMTTAGFMALNRGKVVGNTTYGWLIFTTSHGMMNGGSFRLPFWGCYTLDGQDLETNGGIKPDILIINDLNHDLNGQDPQLDKAIEEILKDIRKR